MFKFCVIIWIVVSAIKELLFGNGFDDMFK